MGCGLGSREVPSALYSRSSKARGTRRRMRGFEGWGRHLRSGPATAAKPTFALTHPSNLRETIGLTTPLSSCPVYATVTVSQEVKFRSAGVQSVPSHPTWVRTREAPRPGVEGPPLRGGAHTPCRPGGARRECRLCLRLQRPIMRDYVTLRRSSDGAVAVGGRSCRLRSRSTLRSCRLCFRGSLSRGTRRGSRALPPAPAPGPSRFAGPCRDRKSIDLTCSTMTKPVTAWPSRIDT